MNCSASRNMKKLLAILLMCAPLAAQTCTPSASQTCTPNISLALPVRNSQSWDTALNSNFTLIDNLLSGNQSISKLAPANINNVIFVEGTKYARTDVGVNAAIAALLAASPNGGDIWLTPGTYSIASTISVSNAGVRIHCMGGPFGFTNAGPSPTPSVLLNWTGGASPVVQFATPSGAGNQIIYGDELDGCAIFGESAASTGLAINSVRNSEFKNLLLINFNGPAIKLGVVAAAADSRDTQYNLIANIQCKQNDGSVADGQDCIQLTGDNSANSSENIFQNLRLFAVNGNAIKDNNGDNNKFYGVTITRGGGGTGKGVYFTGSGSVNTAAREESIFGLDAGTGGLTQDGTAASNSVYGYKEGNGAPLPTITSGQFIYQNDGLGANAGQITLVYGGNSANMLIFDSASAGQSEDLLWKDAGTNEWVLGKNSSNDFSLFDAVNSVQRFIASAGTNGNTTIAAPGSGVVKATSNGVTANVSLAIASGTATMTTAAIAAGACGSTVTVAATGVLTTDAIETSFNASVGANPGVLILQKWPTSGNVNFAYCNPTAGSVTPTASTLNWRVGR